MWKSRWQNVVDAYTLHRDGLTASGRRLEVLLLVLDEMDKNDFEEKVYARVVTFKDDLFTICNVTKNIFWCDK